MRCQCIIRVLAFVIKYLPWYLVCFGPIIPVLCTDRVGNILSEILSYIADGEERLGCVGR